MAKSQRNTNYADWIKFNCTAKEAKKNRLKGINFMHSNHSSTLMKTVFDYFCSTPSTPPNQRIASTPCAQISFKPQRSDDQLCVQTGKHHVDEAFQS